MEPKVISVLIVTIFIILSCKDDNLLQTDGETYNLKSVTPTTFNWETVDWMPTPTGQSSIPVPWIGQGSIASVYDNDVVYDYKNSDGWDLIYNTFDASASGTLQNPYFILYNKYRGLLRIYLYTTTDFVYPSSYVQDGISILGTTSSMLNFCGSDIVDISDNNNTFAQIQPQPIDGSMPLASNKWHMLQYQIAYDPNISELNYQEIQFSWFINFCNVETITLDGEITGEIKSTTGVSGDNNLLSKLGDIGTATGTMALSGLGSYFAEKYTIDSSEGTNSLNIPNDTWKNITKGINSALSSSTSNLPGAIYNVFSAIIGGNSNQTTLFMDVNLDVELTGDKTGYGSFPSSPTTLYIPGTVISSEAQGYIPLKSYNLGVFNLEEKPLAKVHNTTVITQSGSPREGFSTNTKYIKDFTKYDNSEKLIINPDVESEASIQLVDEDLLVIRQSSYGSVSRYTGATLEESGSYDEIYVNRTQIIYTGSPDWLVAVRMTLTVTPNNGAPASTIIKTFIADLESDGEIIFELD